MSDNEPNRLKDTRLDADVSVLGDDRGGEPKVSRVGGAPAPDAPSGLAENLSDGGARPGGGSGEDEIARARAASEAQRDVVDRFGKG
ncbi:hypothetical protein [Aureimonas sp. AU40]|uniref:hypothetical protein n=1 Tax=Aureimonas sp. AU40 TaxID=1637747 RepID=UPI0007855018|nr:hypothetical protein [Aureimonas sp. AU40]